MLEPKPQPESAPESVPQTSPRKKASVPAKKPVAPAAALIQKKAPRRGIRLKNDTDEGHGYD